MCFLLGQQGSNYVVSVLISLRVESWPLCYQYTWRRHGLCACQWDMTTALWSQRRRHCLCNVIRCEDVWPLYLLLRHSESQRRRQGLQDSLFQIRGQGLSASLSRGRRYSLLLLSLMEGGVAIVLSVPVEDMWALYLLVLMKEVWPLCHQERRCGLCTIPSYREGVASVL